jgi:hypothetical protein
LNCQIHHFGGQEFDTCHMNICKTDSPCNLHEIETEHALAASAPGLVGLGERLLVLAGGET